MIPVVDVSDDPSEVAGAIDDACHRIGFFQIVGHGIDPSIESAAWEAAAAFFRLPIEQKLVVSIPPGDAYGYGPYRAERLAASLGDETPPDLKETFSIGPDDAACAAGAAADPAAAFVYSRTPWPAVPTALGPALRSYYDELAGLVDRLLGHMAVGLGLGRDHFVPYVDRHTSALRALHYPPVDRVPEPGQLRAGAHTDYGTLTLLRQSGPGLQVRGTDDAWHDVPVVAGAYVVNIGDALERWTNGRWRSTLHRVVIPPGESVDRQSVAFFHNANWDAVIECLPTCVAEGDRPEFEPITAGRHLMEKFRRTRATPGSDR